MAIQSPVLPNSGCSATADDQKHQQCQDHAVAHDNVQRHADEYPVIDERRHAGER